MKGSRLKILSLFVFLLSLCVLSFHFHSDESNDDKTQIASSLIQVSNADGQTDGCGDSSAHSCHLGCCPVIIFRKDLVSNYFESERFLITFGPVIGGLSSTDLFRPPRA